MKDRFDKIDSTLVRIDDKLDNHLERLSATETDLAWLKGHVKITISIGLSLLAGLITYIIALITK